MPKKTTTTFVLSSDTLRAEAEQQLSAAGFTTERDALRPGEKGAALKVHHDAQDITKVTDKLRAIDPMLKTRHD
ncbi:MAG: hypothetical protein H0V49_01165 [Nocardioidaceae bacterium]|nr:hypothetical protein [Nocardioidaceae bacterium]